MTVATFRISDRTDRSPIGYRVRVRRLSEIRAVVMHQMGVGTWAENNPMFDRVRAHFVVLPSGLVLQLHPISQRMRYGCGHGNESAINIEFAGNFPTSYSNGKPVYWKPEKFGRSVLSPAQIEAGRALLAWLAGQVRGLQVGAHRQLEEGKPGCCGPDLWREVGQHAVDVLGLGEMPTNGGLDIPDDWRGSASPILREYTGPLSVAANVAP